LLKKECSLAGFAHSIGCDNACRTSTDDDNIPFGILSRFEAAFQWSGAGDVEKDRQSNERS
jgi:hypothetical protein